MKKAQGLAGALVLLLFAREVEQQVLPPTQQQELG